MSYAVEFTQGAEDDLMRLYAGLLDRAETLEELDVADEAVKVIRQAALAHLSTTPSLRLTDRSVPAVGPPGSSRSLRPFRSGR